MIRWHCCSARRRRSLQIANDHGFRHFTDAEAFKRYAETEVLALAGEAEVAA